MWEISIVSVPQHTCRHSGSWASSCFLLGYCIAMSDVIEKCFFIDCIQGLFDCHQEKLYQKMFRLTANKLASEKGWSREAMIRLSAAVDLATWCVFSSKLQMFRFRRVISCFHDFITVFIVSFKVLSVLNRQSTRQGMLGHCGEGCQPSSVQALWRLSRWSAVLCNLWLLPWRQRRTRIERWFANDGWTRAPRF